MRKNFNKGFIYLRWKRKDNIAVFLIIVIGLLMTSIGFLYNNFYGVFLSLCLGFFIGGFILSIISTFLAQMESNITGAGEIDAEVDVDVDAEIDIDADIDAEVDIDIDSDIDIDTDVDVDYDIEAEIDVDAVEVEADIDVEAGVEVDSDLDVEMEGEFDSSLISTITPAPIMLLFSTAFLVYGISGLSLYYLVGVNFRYLIFFVTPIISFLSVKLINSLWKILAKSRYYRISSTMNLIGKEGEVILKIDERGGIIKVPSKTPLKFERLHVKPVKEESTFERGDRVYICDVKNGYLLVDNNRKSINKKRR
jgi:membrane-bound ClpP family serine protease